MVVLGGWVFLLSEVPLYPCAALGVAAPSLALSPAFSPTSLSVLGYLAYTNTTFLPLGHPQGPTLGP
jgi:hypothetical protein